MQKRGSWVLIAGIVFIVLLIIVLFFYFATVSPNNEKYYIEQEEAGQLVNPVLDLTIEEAKNQFNESFVYYLLYQIKAYNLHNPPLSGDVPKIEILVDEENFNSFIEDGTIYVSRGEIDNEDILIKTTKEEAVKMLKSSDYVSISFEEGKSGIELKASKTLLFSKGYLGLYTDLTGKSVTGNVIRIYAD